MLSLEIIAKSLSRNAGERIFKTANIFQITSNDVKEANNVYYIFCGLAANLILVILFASLLFVLNVQLLMFIGTSVLIVVIFTAKVLRGNSLTYFRIKQWVQNQTKFYLNFNANLIFFFGFIVILTSFYQEQGGNAILAILSLLLLRKIVTNLSNALSTKIKLEASRKKINSLIFPSISMDQSGKFFKDGLWFDRLTPLNRYTVAVSEFRQFLPNHKVLNSCWKDSDCGDVKILTFTTQSPDGEKHNYLQQVFLPKSHNQLSNEACLLDFIPGEQLRMAEVIHSYDMDDYKCRILDVETVRNLNKGTWSDVQRMLLTETWSIKPPEVLINHYSQTYKLLSDRLSSEACAVLAVAIDTKEESDVVERFIKSLSFIKRTIAMQPLVLVNLDININNIFQRDQEYKIIRWGRWHLEPLGAALVLTGQTKLASDYVKVIASKRGDFKGRGWEKDLELAALALQWEQQLKRENYKVAFSIMKKMLDAIDSQA